MSVAGNSIYIEDDNTFGSPAFGYGIAAYNDAANVSISSNTLEAIASISNSVSLVYCDDTQGPTINCNYVSNSYFGFEFSGNNPGTVWQGNTMCTNWAGLALTNGGIIGQQGNMAVPSGNYWDQSCATWNTPAAQYHTYCNNSNAAASILYVTGSLGFVPTYNAGVSGGTAYVGGSSVFNTANTFPTGLCSASYPNVPAWRTASGSNEGIGVMIDNINPNVRLYPNPANGRVVIDYPEQSIPVQLTVFDLTGKIINVFANIENSKATIDVSALPASVYLLELSLENSTLQRFKLVKTN